MGTFFGFPTALVQGSVSASAFPKLGARLAFASPAGVIAAAPAGFSANPNSPTGRLIVSLPSGNATWSSLTAGYDGQMCEIVNMDAGNTLTLPIADWGGPVGAPDTVLNNGNKILAYYDVSLGAWQVTAP